MLTVKASLRNAERLPSSLRVGTLLLMQVVLVFYRWAVNTTETCSRSQWVTAGEGRGGAPAVTLWYKFHFLPSILTAGEIL